MRPFLVHSAVDALTDRTLGLRIAGLSGRGERLSIDGRFWERRPALSVSLEAPDILGLPGILSVEGLWDRQAYATSGSVGGAVVSEDRRRAAVSLADWWGADLQAAVGVGLDTWGRGAHPSVFAQVDRRLAGDRVSLRAEGAGWMGSGDQKSFASWAAAAAWRSAATSPGGGLASARVGLYGATGGAPLAVWPGAGVGHARPLLLRAHPLLTDGVIAGEGFGRILVHAGVEAETSSWRFGLARLDLAAFVDAARVWQPPEPTRGLAHLDLGVGLRLRLPGQASALRLDCAAGLGGGFAVSAGWQKAWPQ
jgi:hypothetical protein